MGSAFANFAANKELKDRILFTMVMFFVFRLGVHIPVPGVDTSILESLFILLSSNEYASVSYTHLTLPTIA